jgi:hypothetical protein
MSAISALKAACAAGIRLGGDGDDLVLEAAAPPPAVVIDLLSRASLASWRCCGRGPDGWSAEDWQVFFDICPCLKCGKTPGVVQRPTRRRRKTRLIGATWDLRKIGC